MNLDYDAQRTYCEALGILSADESRSAIWENDTAQQVCGLLDAMGREAGKMASAKRWVLSALGDDDRRLDGEEIHSAISLGGLARQAVDYDCAAAAYQALQEQLQRLVVRIRSDQGYETRAFSRLEDHPVLTPSQDQARRDLATLEAHLAEFAEMTPTAARRHLAEAHAQRATRSIQAAQLLALHAELHELELDARREVVSSIDPDLLAAANGRR